MVRYLTSYVANPKENIIYRVNIENEVKKYKLKNKNDSKPVIVFDFIGTISLLFKYISEAMCGGREGECIRRAEMIFEKLRSLDIELHFFLDGPMKRIKAPKWCQSKSGEHELLKQFLSNLEDQDSVKVRMRKYLKTYYENYLRVAKKYGRIFISLDNECDMDIAEHASRVRPMAVFANDSDFLVMPGDFPIWLPDSFDLKTMTVDIQNKRKLRTSLKLEQWQMPLLATLLGNDWLQHEHVKHFHEKLIPEGDFDHVKHVKAFADLVRSKFESPKERDLASKLAGLIYDREKSKISFNEIVQLVQRSVDFFDYKTRKVTKLEPDWLRDHVLHTASFVVFTMYTQGVLLISQPYIGYSKQNTVPYADLILPLLRRELGIMYYSRRKSNNEIKQDICLKRSENEPFAMHQYTPIYPDFDVPPMDDILSDDEDIMPLESRLELLAWIVAPNRKSLKLESIQKILRTIYILPSIVTNYLHQMGQITVDEADSLLLTIFEAYKIDPAKSASLQPPVNYVARPFFLSFIYTNSIRYFLEAMIFCGLNEFVPYSYYDGYIFHKVYHKFSEISCEQKKKLLEPIAEYRLYSL